MSTIQLCACAYVFISIHVQTSDAGPAAGSYPVHDEDLAYVEFVLELLGSNGHGVEETEAPVDKRAGRKEGRQPHVIIRTSSLN